MKVWLTGQGLLIYPADVINAVFLYQLIPSLCSDDSDRKGVSFITLSSGVIAPVDTYFQTNLGVKADQSLFHCEPINS